MVSIANPDHPVGSMKMKGNEVGPPSWTKCKDVLDGVFEFLVFGFYYDVIDLVCEVFELFIGRWSLFEEEASKLYGFPMFVSCEPRELCAIAQWQSQMNYPRTFLI